MRLIAEKSNLPSPRRKSLNAVMPAQAGTQCMFWAPVFTGVTTCGFRRYDGSEVA